MHTYTLWMLIGDHPILAVVLLLILLQGIADIVKQARKEWKSQEEDEE